MPSDLPKELQGRWAEYLHYLKAGAMYSAFVRLGEILNCLNHCRLPQGKVQEWRAMVLGTERTEEEIRSAQTEAKREAARMHDIMSVGSKFEYEELVLLITMRVELELLSEYLADRNVVAAVDGEALDRELGVIAKSAANAATFRSAQLAARTNWGIPLHSAWLHRIVEA